MIREFITSFKLRNAYNVNSFIYSLKSLPLIRRILPDSLYEDKTLKILGNIVSIIKEIVSIFLWKLLYVFFMVFLVSSINENDWPNSFIHIFTFLTLCGGILNTYMFNSSKDEYYAISVINMDARKYTLSNYYYSLIKVILGFMPFTILFGRIVELSLSICVMMPIYVVMVKTIANNYNIWRYQRRNKIDNGFLEWFFVLVFLVMAYTLPFIGISINENVFVIIFIISFILGIYSFVKIYNFNGYKKMCKKLLDVENVFLLDQIQNIGTIKENIQNQIELDKEFNSDKIGFAYFHDLFVKRHRKILTKTVKLQAIIIAVIFAIVIAVSLIIPEVVEGLNNVPLTYLPWFVFLMYGLNRGTTLTQAMFMNCDHSMLTYRFYRTPKVILGMFKQRLKTLISLNLLPAMVIATGLPLVLWATGGTDNILNYVVLFVSIIAMSIFFSVHYLVMYYLLQPYNINTEMKSATYKTVETLTYVVCYSMMEFHLPTLAFGMATIIFSLVYSVIALALAYVLAPKTFKIRI